MTSWNFDPDTYTQGQDADDLVASSAQPQVEEYDFNGDGMTDTVFAYQDTNGDGVYDTKMTSLDLDGDGFVDYTAVHVDTDGDGYADYSESASAIDWDGDGQMDSVFYGQDTDGDGFMETTQLYTADEWASFSTPEVPYTPDPGEGEGFSAGYEQFDPNDTNMDQVVGTPTSDEQYWEYQGESGPCAIYAQVMAYEAMTGQDIDPQEMINVAYENGWYSGSGTTMEDMDKILNYLGADTEKGFGGDLQDLQECLERGGRAVVAIDGNEVWYGNTDTYAPNDPNHAVEVIGIDYSGEEPMVIINDSGTQDGHAIMVPASQFMDAWEDSNFYYVEAYA